MTDINVDTVARTICGEARSQGQSGMADVACVIVNRADIAASYVAAHSKNHPLFGDGTDASACTANWHGVYQFSCWTPGDPNLPIIQNLNIGMAIFRQALDIAQQACGGELDDRTMNSTHYKVIGTYASWAVGKTPCYTNQQHEFYNNID